MTLYDTLLDKAYNSYVDTWCRNRGYSRDAVNPSLGINGECYVCRAEFADCEFSDPSIAQIYLTDFEYEQYKQIMEVSDG